MNLTLRPTTSLDRIFSDWLRPDTIFDKDFFDTELFPVRLGVNVPSVNIKETSKEYALEVAAPGLERKDFNIEVENHSLIISAKKEEKKEEKKEDEGYSRKEYSYNSFCRSFALPENVKEGDIDAKYENGILTVHVPKAKETPVKPAQKIAVK
ncbi:MAG TPA: Hsp20/alpha crystallin family protein [Cyclobacteriaceae bacterium]|nr:Hsp20/alpha crystallin family protein [Cyclobacteriaceae bacterium]